MITVYFSFHKDNNACYLKSAEAETADADYDTNYQTTMKGCTTNNCVLQVNYICSVQKSAGFFRIVTIQTVGLLDTISSPRKFLVVFHPFPRHIIVTKCVKWSKNVTFGHGIRMIATAIW